MRVDDFRGKGVIVTGALGGIGMATARLFAQAGARLVLADLRAAGSDVIADLIAAGAEAVESFACDMGDEGSVASLIEKGRMNSGNIDVIVSVAGAMLYRPVAEMSGDDWRRMLAINLVGPALLTAAGLRHMKPGGAIVNVASVHARQTTPEVAGYAAAKAGMCSMSRTAAIEGKPLGIRVNTVLPGAIDTKMLRDSPTIKSGAEKLDPADVGQPIDIAETIFFLASDGAAFITGAEIVADGGRLARL